MRNCGLVLFIVAGGCGDQLQAPGDGGGNDVRQPDSLVEIADAAIVVDARVPVMNAPALVALTCGAEIPVQGKIDCTINIDYADGTAVYHGAVGVGLHGRSSLGFVKKNYAIELRKSDGSDNPVDLFGMGADADYLLGLSYIDRSLMRNKLAYDVFREMLRWTVETRYAELTVNGVAKGLVMIAERIERGAERLAMPPDDGTGKSFIVKGSDQGIASTVQARSWEPVYPKVSNAGVEERIAALEQAIKRRDPNLLEQFDLNEFVDFVILEEAFRNNDAYFLSHHMYQAGDGKIGFVPWDMDLTLGQPSYNNNELTDGWIAYRPELIAVPAAYPLFRTLLVARWRQLRQAPDMERTSERWGVGSLATASLLHRIDDLRQFLGSAIDRNWQVWSFADTANTGFPLYPVVSPDEEYIKVKDFITARFAWIDANIENY
jgi:spore coat protein H